MSRNRTWTRLLNTAIVAAARLRLPTYLLHRLRYGRSARFLRLSRGAFVLCESLAVRGPVSLGRDSWIQGRDVDLGSHIRIDEKVHVMARSIHLGDNIIINHSVEIGGAQLESSSLEIGSGVWVFPNCYLNTTTGLSIGDGTGIGGYCLIWTHGSWQSYLDGFPVRFAATRLGKNVWLPWHVIVMPGVTIGDHSTIAAGSVVTKDIPEHALAAGTPAKVIKQGAAVWPGEQTAVVRSDRLLEVTRHFAAWLGNAFDWKALTLLGAAEAGRIREETGGRFRFATAGGELGIALAAPPATADAAWLYVIDAGGPLPQPDGARNWIDLAGGRYSLADPHPLFRSYVTFLSQYGIRLIDSRSGRLNSLGA